MPPTDIYDQIAQKRAAATQSGDDIAKEQRSLAAITGSGQQLAAVIHDEAEKSRQNVQPVSLVNDTLAQRDDIQAVVQSIMSLQGASREQLSTLSTIFTQAITHIAEAGGQTSLQTAEVFRQTGANLTENLVSLREDQHKSAESLLLAVSKLVETVDRPERELPAPIVNVKPAQVTVQERTLDLSPVIDALNSLKQPEAVETIDLDEYRAQDLRDDGKDMQYVGFVNPDGNWYIIENNVKANTMRYLFGLDNYQTYFQNASRYTYQLLNEAINATA